MSRIGRRPIPLPKGTTVQIQGSDVAVQGPKGRLALELSPGISAKLTDGQVVVERASDERQLRALHGLNRNLLSNMVTGVTTGYQRSLEIRGVGFRAEVSGRSLNLVLGFSHPVVYEIPEGISIAIDKQVRVNISGIDKQLVGAVAAKIRGYRPPDIYKGKGIRYVDEEIKLKAGKSGGK